MGGATGLAAGYLGIGGGIILVPVLSELFLARGMELDRVMTSAFATSLFTALFTTGAAAWRQWRQDNLIVEVIPAVSAGAVIGGQGGAYLGSRLSGGLLMLAFALFLMAAAVYMSIQPRGEERGRPARSAVLPMVLLGLVTGVLAGLFGVGGGILLVPAFILLFHLPAGKVAGTSSAVAFLISVSAVAGYLLYGADRSAGQSGFVGVIDVASALPISLGTVVSAQWGAVLNKRFGGVVFRRIFALFLALVAARMMMKSLGIL